VNIEAKDNIHNQDLKSINPDLAETPILLLNNQPIEEDYGSIDSDEESNVIYLNQECIFFSLIFNSWTQKL
jgi:hypothetical protein